MHLTDDAAAFGRIINRDGPQSVLWPTSLPQWYAAAEIMGGAPGVVEPPDWDFLCQESSGNLIDSMQGVAIAPSGPVSYANSYTGWVAKHVATVDGTSGQGFGVGAGTLWNVNTQDVVLLLTFGHTSCTVLRTLLMLSSGSLIVAVRSSGVVGGLQLTGPVNGTVSYADGLKHPMLVEILGGAGMMGHVGAGLLRVSTDKEQITGTWSLQPDGQKGLGGAGFGATPGVSQFGRLSAWAGTKAVNLSNVGPNNVLQRMGWAVTGY